MKVLSLFTGAGGLDVGLETAGFKIAACVEVDGDARQTLRRNRPKWALLDPGDIYVHDVDDMLGAAAVSEGELALLSCGPPCQPFSKASLWRRGRARGLQDPRAKTIDALLDVVEAAIPDVVLIENVPGISASNSGALELIRRRLKLINRRRGTNYIPSSWRLDARDFGVPQQRTRLFVVAARDGQAFAAPAPTHTRDAPNVANRWRTVWDAIGDTAVDDRDDLSVGGQWADLLPSIPEGQNYLWHTPRGGGEPLFGWRTRYWSFLLKLAKDRPAWTLQATPGPATGPFHWENRRLSRSEMARLQTLPTDYRIEGTYNAAQRQLGNAVPAALGELIGLLIRRQRHGSRVRKSLCLATSYRGDSPRPCEPADVPHAFHAMRAAHRPHPGPGRGPGARGDERTPTTRGRAGAAHG